VTEHGGVPVLATTVAVVENAPAIFTYQRAPNAVDPIIVHEDGSLVTPGRPAAASELLIAYGTGVGALDHAPATGSPTPASPPSTSLLTPSIIVGGLNAQPTFTGLSAGICRRGAVQVSIAHRVATRPVSAL
jgi:uncharacterized protein (TIGR03437 family)